MPDTNLQPPELPCRHEPSASGIELSLEINDMQEHSAAVDHHQSLAQRADGSGTNPPSSAGKTVFEMAVELVEHYKGWIDWDDFSDVIRKPLICAISLLTQTDLGKCIPGILEHLMDCAKKDYDEHNLSEFYQSYSGLRDSTLRDLTEFICQPNIDPEKIRQGLERYRQAQYTLYLIDFLLFHRPCCRLFQIVWLIPAIATGMRAIPLIAYAAEELAEFPQRSS